jgi:transposase-like protein
MSASAHGAQAADSYLATALAAVASDAAANLDERAHSTVVAIREARFGDAPHCPRCSSHRVQRWGRFGMRRRYRCTGCRHTFSDLTNTVFAYSKHLELWLPYAACLLESLSVRAAARRLGIDKDTAWRWRHRLLSAHASLPVRPLRGTAELVERRFGVCEKGRRHLPRAGLHRATHFYPSRRPSISVLFMRDEHGSSFASTAGTFPLHPDALEGVLAARFLGLRRLVAPHSLSHAIAHFACRHRLIYEQVPFVALRAPASLGAVPPRVRHVFDDVLRFRAWLRRFRGVATRYLDRYLHWHHVLERVPDARLALLLEVGRAPPGRI